MRNTILVIAVWFSAVAGNNLLHAQTAKADFDQLLRDDSADVNVIALYNAEVREKLFRVCLHPEGVAQLNDAQSRSNESFKNLLSSRLKEDQQKIWNLTRYPGLVSELAKTKGKKKSIEKALKKFPAEVHDDALYVALNHQELIVSTEQINKEFDSAFQAIIAGYPDAHRSAFRDLMNHPEAFSLLSRNMHLAVHVGSIYKNDPVYLRQQFDSLNVILAEQNAREKEEWTQEMKQNPEAEKEMRQSAEQYAKDNSYAESDYRDTDPQVVERTVYVPYPYWCGYPWWYDMEYWYPYPVWYHWGFYYWHGGIVWLGTPSWYFMHWHFHHFHHCYEYPHLTNAYLDHYYYGPRRAVSRNSMEVRSWMSRNETHLPADFRSNKEQRVVRLRELGKSETDREIFNRANPGRNATREEFMKQHTDDYPSLKRPAPVQQPVQIKTTLPEEKLKNQPADKPVKEKQKIYMDKSIKTNPPPPKTKATPQPRPETPKTLPPAPRTAPPPPPRQQTPPPSEKK